MTPDSSLATTILLTPERSGLCADRDNVVDVLVRVQAPDAPTLVPTATRAPQALALVIDRSGSMAGRPLEEARRCAEFVASRMRSIDAVSLVQFDNRVDRLWPAVPLGSAGKGLLNAIGRIGPGGNTNLHGGWVEGAQSLAEAQAAGLKRVILLSDGCANEGLTDPGEIAAACATWASRGITTSTYGLGNNFNEELMVAMARSGSGNHYYGDTAEDLMEPFQHELDLLSNLCLSHVRLSVTTPTGVTAEVLNELHAADGGWGLPDLAWGSEAWALVRVRVPSAAIPARGDRFTVLRVCISGQDPDGRSVTLEQTGLALTVLSPSTFETMSRDELVVRRATEIEAASVLTRMRAAVRERNWREVDRLLAEARTRFTGCEWVADIISAMADLAHSRSRERMMKEAMYSSSRLNSRLAAKDELAAADYGAEALAYVSRKPLQGKKR